MAERKTLRMHGTETFKILLVKKELGSYWKALSLYMTIEGVRIDPLMLLWGRTEAPLTSSSSLIATVQAMPSVSKASLGITSRKKARTVVTEN